MAYCAFVIGCTGQDGSYLSKSLLNKGYKVIGISRKKIFNTTNHKKLKIENHFEIIQDLLNSISSFKKLIEKYVPNEIYHLSAQSSVGKSFEQPSETFKSIVLSTNVILESCKAANYNGKIFFAGSSEMFGETQIAANLNSRIQPVSPYGYAKYQSLLMCNMYKHIPF